jgi:hypothetical protein
MAATPRGPAPLSAPAVLRSAATGLPRAPARLDLGELLRRESTGSPRSTASLNSSLHAAVREAVLIGMWRVTSAGT